MASGTLAPPETAGVFGAGLEALDEEKYCVVVIVEDMDHSLYEMKCGLLSKLNQPCP
jgi:hypothetical protein